jgi:hypothetical protein
MVLSILSPEWRYIAGSEDREASLVDKDPQKISIVGPTFPEEVSLLISMLENFAW